MGFRPWVWQLAQRDGVAGRVRNDSAGVIIDAFGSDDDLEHFTRDLRADAPPAARVRTLDWQPIPFDEKVRDFEIVASENAHERHVSIPPDLATCGDCLHEVLDPSNRRYRYPFTNCTNCGPRYTIVRDVPYDRDRTTMARFAMCEACRAEYDDPRDRRFHAQPNGCPSCGPTLTAVTPKNQPVATDDPIRFAARTLRAQMIVAIKGLGGFHLACDATSNTAVARLRDRKKRDAKPFAVMVRDLEEAELVAVLTDEDRNALTSPERPIVLVQNRRVLADVAPNTSTLGIFLPYTPLHHLLLREFGAPLVMTSGNTSDEPMVTTNADALERLGEIADLFLLHDRDIETRADDSIVRAIDGAPVILRRGRGFVPRAIEVRTPFATPVLAVGAQLKNTICIGTGNVVVPGPHIGDLETLETLHSFEQSIEQLTKFLGVEPKIVAHDLHPDYDSTAWAMASGLVTIGVQHHHAHVVSAMAEHGLTEAIGIAFDGTGFGTDGTSWGGEFLRARFDSFERLATLRPIPLAGGDKAIREVWRIALALLDDAFEGDPPPLPLFENKPADAVRRMLAQQVNAPLARGAGRYFDAFGAMVLGIAESRFEGEVAMRWNDIADPHERRCWEVVVRDGQTPWELDFRPAVKAAIQEMRKGVPPSILSARFHNTLAYATIEVARACNPDRLPFVLSGGCFQNALLAERVLRALPDSFINREIPPGDGGIAVGQAVIAGALSCA